MAGTTTQTKTLTSHSAPNIKTLLIRTIRFSIATADVQTGFCSPTTAFALNKISTTVLHSEFGLISTKVRRIEPPMMTQKTTTEFKNK
jgi:hypothetical protein